LEGNVWNKHFQSSLSCDGVGECYRWVDVSARNSAEQKDDQGNCRSKCESDDDESLESSDALS
jgi:hypothetical protein